MNWIAWTILFFLIADFLLHLAADLPEDALGVAAADLVSGAYLDLLRDSG